MPPADHATSVGSRELKVKSIVTDGQSPYKWQYHKHLMLRQQLYYVVFLSSAICYLLFLYYQPEFSVIIDTGDQCAGRYIYVHNIPGRFNADLVRSPQCRKLYWAYDMCVRVANDGFGPPLNVSDGVLSDTGWYNTEQFTLEVIFHSRMKKYECLTNDSSMASAIYLPFYVGLDFGRHTWGYNTSVRDALSLEFVRWVKAAPEWKAMDGRDHFMVAGRTTWDLRRWSENDGYGGLFLNLPEIKNMTVLIIESSPWNSNDFAIPYPTFFHPSQDSEVLAWQDRMRMLERPWLFCFVGGTRGADTTGGSIRNRIISQCSNSTRCGLLGIASVKSKKYYTVSSVLKLFQSSVFCLQPPGDSPTRKSTFDSMISGCIPVFFTPKSAYVQYTWHLPTNYTKYSVLISQYDLLEGKVEIEEVLKKFSEQELRDMREEVIKTIPRLIYRRSKSKSYEMKDAFDVAVERVLERVEETRRIKKQGLPLPEFNERESWKRALGWTGGRHEWDYYLGASRHP